MQGHACGYALTNAGHDTRSLQRQEARPAHVDAGDVLSEIICEKFQGKTIIEMSQ